MVVSAGPGLSSSTTLVPAYACTVIAGTDDNIVDRLTDASSAADWWRSISKSLPLSCSIAEAFATSEGLVLAALSDAYADLIADEVEALPDLARNRLRLFTRAPKRRIAAALRPFIMPYDDRLDGPDSPIRGTRGDFAPRAMRHFAESILIDGDDRDAATHIAAVEAAIATWAFPDRPERARHDDPTSRAMIAEHWDTQGGSTSRLLPYFRRELNIACEQGRFAALVRDVRSARARSEEHTSELQSLMRISYAVFCLKKTINTNTQPQNE